MKRIITNINNLKEEDITDLMTKVKILLINSQNEIILGYSHNEYQFPGGTREPNEELINTVNREIEEETGMTLSISALEPFACSIGYYKDWPTEGRNKKVEIYYYEVKTDEMPNLENTKYTEHEREGIFELRYIQLDNVEEELKKNANEFGDPHGITKEMLNLFELYKEKNRNN